MPEQPRGALDSRGARGEAIEAALLWAVALIVTVGGSTLLGSLSLEAVLGVPAWAAYGVFAPWIVFFFLHLRFCRRRQHDDTERKA